VRSPLAIDYRLHERTIATLERALREHLVLNCRYRAVSTRQMSARFIEPGELYWDPGLESLYLIGWCRLRGDVRVFAVQRFLMASATEETFLPRPETRSKAALKSAFRVWRSEHVHTVRVRFSPDVAEEIRERQWQVGQKLEQEAGGGVVLTMKLAGLPEVERWILGWGPDAEVLAPPALVARVAARRKAAAGIGTGRRARTRRLNTVGA
jgi:predicted DNA-binding transcriptional regulator YafY